MFSTISCLNQHISKTHQSGPKKFQCKYDSCEFESHSKDALDAHMNIHLDIKPFKCDFPGCDYQGKGFNEL